jgi:molybdopterin molybdotransferase
LGGVLQLSEMKTVDEARNQILASIPVQERIKVCLKDSLGLVLAEEITAPFDLPQFDNSAMDGYAVRYEDCQSVSSGEEVLLKVIEKIPAGTAPLLSLEKCEAARIMTGGKVPAGADTVIMREHTSESEESVVILEIPGKGENIRKQGGYFHSGSRLLEAGTEIDPGSVGLIASLGLSHVSVFRPPVVAIIATGDELVPLGEPLREGEIYNSSAHMVEALLLDAGAIPLRLPIARDNFEACRSSFELAISRAHMVVSLGGVSVGDYDVVRSVMNALKPDMGFWKVKMKPGKPLAFGCVDNTPLFGLPGNPVSTYVCFYQFVWPSIQQFMGRNRDSKLVQISAILTQPVRSPDWRTDFQRGRINQVGGVTYFEPYDDQGSGNLMSLSGPDGLAIIPIGVSKVEAGETVNVECIPSSRRLSSASQDQGLFNGRDEIDV